LQILEFREKVNKESRHPEGVFGELVEP